MHRFLARVYRFVTRGAARTASKDGSRSDADRKALRKLHQTLKRATEDFDTRWHFNTSIAAIMELMNEVTAVEDRLSPGALRELLEKLVLLMGPFAPYLAEELWSELGHQGPVFRQKWPAYDPELAREDVIQIVVQVNGKVRSHISVENGASREELERLSLADSRVRHLIDGKPIVKVIVVPDKLVNIVVK
jgi:leucyl-tRNA synthetase